MPHIIYGNKFFADVLISIIICPSLAVINFHVALQILFIRSFSISINIDSNSPSILISIFISMSSRRWYVRLSSTQIATLPWILIAYCLLSGFIPVCYIMLCFDHLKMSHMKG